jgi:hypothetical protein
MPTADFADIIWLGDASVDAETALPVAQAVIPAGDEEGDVENLGELDMFNGLGITALPAPKTDDGVAEGVLLRNVGGSDGAIVGARDARSADVVAELGPGETCLHSTGPDYGSRVFCKEDLVAIVVGDDTVVTIDRAAKQINIAGFGHVFEMSKEQGVVISESGGANLIMKGGVITLAGTVILGSQPAGAVPISVGFGGLVVSPSVKASVL